MTDEEYKLWKAAFEKFLLENGAYEKYMKAFKTDSSLYMRMRLNNSQVSFDAFLRDKAKEAWVDEAFSWSSSDDRWIDLDALWQGKKSELNE